MNVYLARQPIFDRRKNVVGYELLYRDSMENRFSGIDDNQATRELINHVFLVMDLDNLVGSGSAFVNFSKAMIESEIPDILPPERVVIEVVEREEATKDTIDALLRLKEKGFTIALDDFTVDSRSYMLLPYADIVKVEYPVVKLEDQARLLNDRKDNVLFLAEKIETELEYRAAMDIGYDYFQGFFFSRPEMFSATEIRSLDVNVIHILQELRNPDVDYASISNVIAGDMGISYKLLKLANSAYYGASRKFQSIEQALIYIGINELHHWFTIMLLRSLQSLENAETIKFSMIRGKLMESMARELGVSEQQTVEYFFMGMFSYIDVLLNRPMGAVLATLPLSDAVKHALLGGKNDYRDYLDCVMAFELADWNKALQRHPINKIGSGRFMELYLDALKWAEQLNY
ncbi:MAG: HDOD domain-containing protein [Anaerovoracaceae bacterium]